MTLDGMLTAQILSDLLQAEQGGLVERALRHLRRFGVQGLGELLGVGVLSKCRQNVMSDSMKSIEKSGVASKPHKREQTTAHRAE